MYNFLWIVLNSPFSRKREMSHILRQIGITKMIMLFIVISYIALSPAFCNESKSISRYYWYYYYQYYRFFANTTKYLVMLKYYCPFKVEHLGILKVDGGWGSWTAWTLCSSSCGAGRRFRDQYCNNPKREGNGKDCLGGHLAPLLKYRRQEEQCNHGECPGTNRHLSFVLLSFVLKLNSMKL